MKRVALPGEDQIFNVARQIDSEEARRQYLDQVCSDNPQVREEVEQLLELHEKRADFMESPPLDLQATSRDIFGLTIGAGEMLGPYKILERIGEGGMGHVYMAEQSEPVYRLVALKVVKNDMDSKSVIARFEAERKALALMDHPNIARFYEAGMTDQGRPYFVMELVRGRPITVFCKQHKLDLAAKLALFSSVCQAVQHAHQKGIIHRDLKPSNVLVARYDDRPVAKVIDFGVAKALGEKLTDKTMFTRFGQLVGTLEYMSPEQAQLNQLDVDTRSDIYSLGAILYELLTGEPPFENEKLSSAGLDEALRVIREDDPTIPSSRLSTPTTNAAGRRLTTARKNLHRNSQIPSELDWIVMKCLEKDRSRRYSTANDLAEDIRRHLNNETISAGRPTNGYRLKKLFLRHQIAISVGAIVGAILILGTGISAWQAVRASLANHRTTQLLTQVQRQSTSLATALEREQKLTNQLDDSLGIARQNLDTATSAIDTMLAEVTETELRYAAQTDRIRQRFLYSAANFYTNLIANSPEESSLAEAPAELWIRAGEVETLLGNTRAALINLQKSISLLESHDNPSERNQMLRGYAYRKIAGLLAASNQEQAVQSYEASEEIYTSLGGNVVADQRRAIDSPDSDGQHRFDVRLQTGLVQQELATLLYKIGPKKNARSKLEEARKSLVAIDDDHAQLAIAEIDLLLADDDPKKLGELVDRLITDSRPNEHAIGSESDHLLRLNLLDFYERLYDKLEQANVKRGLPTGKIIAGWKNLLYFYPTAHRLKYKIAEYELKQGLIIGWAAMETVDTHRALTREFPTARNIRLLIGLLNAEIQGLQQALIEQQKKPEAKKWQPYHWDFKMRLAADQAALEYWEKRYQVASNTWTGKAIAIGGPQRDSLRAAGIGANGEIFVIGHLNSGAWADPIDPKTQVDSHVNYLAKFDGNGSYLKHIDTATLLADLCDWLAVDDNSNVLIAGNEGVAKLDSDLNLIWKIELGEVTAIACDHDGNVYAAGATTRDKFLAGQHSPGEAIQKLDDNRFGYVVKLSGKGSVLWNWQFSGPGDREVCSAVAIDDEGNVFVSGKSVGQTEFGKTVTGEKLSHTFEEYVNSNNPKLVSYKAFIAKLDSSGEPLWVRPTTKGPNYLRSIVCPSAEQVVFTLSTFHQGDLDPTREYDDNRDMTQGGKSPYVVAYDRDGHLARAPYAATGQLLRDATGMCIDHRGHLFVTGYFWKWIGPDPDLQGVKVQRAQPQSTIEARQNGFLVELDETGEYVDSWFLSGPGLVFPHSISSDSSGRIVIAGNFHDALISPTGDELGSAGGDDGFLIILDPQND